MTLIHNYLKTHRDIPGWFFPEDVRLFIELNQLQAESSLTGDVLEIGAYHGKSAILLGFFLKEQERLFVCDMFGAEANTMVEKTENQTYYRTLKQDDFERNYRRFHDSLPVIFACPSTNLGTKGLTKTFRFIHIDGSHQYDVVRHDIATAKTLIVEGGIVGFDDYRSFHTPGVAAAVWQDMASGTLRPLCATPLKLYVICGQDKFGFLSRLKERLASQSDLVGTSEIVGGQEFLRIVPRESRPPLLKKIYWDIVADFNERKRRS